MYVPLRNNIRKFHLKELASYMYLNGIYNLRKHTNIESDASGRLDKLNDFGYK